MYKEGDTLREYLLRMSEETVSGDVISPGDGKKIKVVKRELEDDEDEKTINISKH